MKRKTFRIDHVNKVYAATKAINKLVIDEILDGSVEVVIQNYVYDRSIPQNSIYYKWLAQIAAALYTTDEEQRNYCKLHFGVPILRADEKKPEFKAVYDRCIATLSYEDKLEAMMLIDVSSIMGVKQMTHYLQQIEMYATEHGVQLVHGDDEYQEAMGRRKK